jgi:hypothetical protein
MMKQSRFSGRAEILQWVAVLLLLACGTASGIANDQVASGQGDKKGSKETPRNPIPAVPCAARANAVIANTGSISLDEQSLVDSYRSARGPYGPGNIGNEGSRGTLRAAGVIAHKEGAIYGLQIENSPAGLGDVPIPANAQNLPRGAKVPGSVHIHDKHDSLWLRPGNYVAADIDLDFPGTLNVTPGSGVVTIFVTGHLSIGGHANLQGTPKNLQLIVLGTHEVRVQKGGTLVGLLYAPHSEVELHSEVFGSVVGSSVRFDEHGAVHYDEISACPPPPSVTKGGPPPPPLPPPAPTKVGCYVYTANGWRDHPCATDAFIKAHFPHPDVQIEMTSTATNRLVFGEVAVTIPQVGSETNAFLPNAFAGCPTSGSNVANQWSIQENVNDWFIGSGPNAGDFATTQFVVMSDGSTNGICIWNIDVTAMTYPATCVVPNPPQRSGGLQAFDFGAVSATANSNGTQTMTAQLSWLPSGQPNTYAVTATDTFDLAHNWSRVGGGILGMGNCTQAQFTDAEVVTQVLASTCTGDTQADSPVCAGPTLQPDVSVGIGALGTLETNNLTNVGSPSVTYLNSDLAMSTVTGTTSGSCLGPSHAYVKDSAADFGATPSTIGNQVFWESPDIFLVPHGAPVDLNAVSSESVLTPGGQFDIWVRVHNDLGCSPVTGAKALVYLADPSALSIQWSSITGGNYVGNNGSSTGVTVPAGGQALIGPLPFTAPTTSIGNGHKCLLSAIEADGEPASPSSSDAPDSNQVAQRNVQFIGPCQYPMTNATTSNGNVQITLTVTPNTGTAPSLTALPDVEATFDDADSSWFNVWNSQPGKGTTFAVSHSGSSTTVRLGAFSVPMNAVPLGAGQTRNATANINPVSGALTLQIAAALKDSGGNTLVTNGGSCTQTVPVIQ